MPDVSATQFESSSDPWLGLQSEGRSSVMARWGQKIMCD
jgi:hypothetical protein